MQERTYSDLLFLIQSLIGGGNLTTDEQGSIESFINRRAHEAFQTSQSWPRFLVSSEKRKIAFLLVEDVSFTGSLDINGVYYSLGSATGSGVQTPSSPIFYISTASEGATTISGTIIYKNTSSAWVLATGAGITKNSDGTFTVSSTGTERLRELDLEKKDSPADVEVWNLGTDVNVAPSPIFKGQFIPYKEALTSSGDVGRDNIGEFLKIHRKKAYLNNSSVEYDFFVDSKGANILNIVNTSDTSAFVTYKKELPQYTITSTDIPGEWFFFIAHASYADFLRMEGQTEKSLIEEETAQKYLALELEKIDNMSNNNVFNRFSTHGTRQSR